MGESVEFESVEFITAGALGPPGQRTFYVQAAAQGRLVSLLAEKEQVRSLSQLAQRLLARAGVTLRPDDLDEAGHRLREPAEPLWRAGSMSLGVDDDAERFLLEVEELPAERDEPDEGQGIARFWLQASQLAGMAAHAAYAVEAGARPLCKLCQRPIEPAGHVCPSLNGHGPK